jgi:hypothetical protein
MKGKGEEAGGERLQEGGARKARGESEGEAVIVDGNHWRPRECKCMRNHTRNGKSEGKRRPGGTASIGTLKSIERRKGERERVIAGMRDRLTACAPPAGETPNTTDISVDKHKEEKGGRGGQER